MGNAYTTWVFALHYPCRTGGAQPKEFRASDSDSLLSRRRMLTNNARYAHNKENIKSGFDESAAEPMQPTTWECLVQAGFAQRNTADNISHRNISMPLARGRERRVHKSPHSWEKVLWESHFPINEGPLHQHSRNNCSALRVSLNDSLRRPKPVPDSP